ncbi:MAG: glycosyltransferase family 39 protein [Vicinamibacteria bacterium]
MIRPKVRTLCVAALAAGTLFPFLVNRMDAPANFGAHSLTTGFGRGRLDLAGIVSEGKGGRLDLPPESLRLTAHLSGDGPIHLQADGVEKTIVGSEAPTRVSLDLPRGGSVAIESDARIRLYGLEIVRSDTPWTQAALILLLGMVAIALSRRGLKEALAWSTILVAGFLLLARGSLSSTFASLAAEQLQPLILVIALLAPLAVALKRARFVARAEISRWSLAAFTASLCLTTIQFAIFDQPLPMGDPAAYFEMGGKYAEAAAGLHSPFALGPALSDLQPYLALPATGVLYGFLRLLGGGGLWLIYAIQALAMACAVGMIVAICERVAGPRAGKIAMGIAVLHPTFSIAPGIVQPEPFIMCAWLMAALVTLRASDRLSEARRLLGAGVLLGLGLCLHPQGLSFLLLALILCLIPWTFSLAKRPSQIAIPLLGAFTVLLPVAAAEHFSKPLAYVLDKQYGFFAYTSPHPLGFWLYTESDGWQGPLRIEDTAYQQELIAMKGETAVSSTFADVAAFVARHAGRSAQTVLTNLHRLWNQPDNPFAVSFVLPYALQIPFHRGLIVLFVLSLPLLLTGRRAILALPFVMLSMTYPAYHVFNKYATPALPFIVIGAAIVLDRLWQERRAQRLLQGALAAAAIGALLPAIWFARVNVSGDLFLILVRGLSWIGLGTALWKAVTSWSADARARILASLIGITVLLGSSIAAAWTDTGRTEWTVAPAALVVSCQMPTPTTENAGGAPLDPAWLLIDAQSDEGQALEIEVNGSKLEPTVPTMPPFGLATFRGHREPQDFRQIWRARVPEELLGQRELQIRIESSHARVFGDLRSGNAGPRISLGNWPYLSVYRLMHEGEYRLPTFDAPPQACTATGLSGRPGVYLARIPAGEESRMALKAAKPLKWIF